MPSDGSGRAGPPMSLALCCIAWKAFVPHVPFSCHPVNWSRTVAGRLPCEPSCAAMPLALSHSLPLRSSFAPLLRMLSFLFQRVLLAVLLCFAPFYLLALRWAQHCAQCLTRPFLTLARRYAPNAFPPPPTAERERKHTNRSECVAFCMRLRQQGRSANADEVARCRVRCHSTADSSTVDASAVRLVVTVVCMCLSLCLPLSFPIAPACRVLRALDPLHLLSAAWRLPALVTKRLIARDGVRLKYDVCGNGEKLMVFANGLGGRTFLVSDSASID